MLVAQVYVPVDRVGDAIAALEASSAARRVVRLGRTVDEAVELVTAELDAGAADQVITSLERAGVSPRDIVIHQIAALRPVEAGVGRRWFGADPEDFVWTQLVGQARRSARLFARYLALMAVAGVIATFGVIGRNGILIVGAMAVSPDLLPICGTCVGIVGRRIGLISRAVSTLAVGMVFAAVSAMLLTLVLRGFGELAGYNLGDGGLGGLTRVSYSTLGIALAAGIAGMLAFETNASSAVGVAISVTTIPAAAYMGVAVGVQHSSQAVGALEVLLTNIVLMLVAGTCTLALQRHLRRERTERAVSGSSSG